jgi:hypothetical protein
MWLAGLTILKKKICLGNVSGCRVDPVVALLHSASGTLQNSEKETCLGIVSGFEVDPVVKIRIRNAADYRLPTFGAHGTKLRLS